MVAERGNETVKSERTSSLITVARARVWASEGWQVTITDDEGKSSRLQSLRICWRLNRREASPARRYQCFDLISLFQHDLFGKPVPTFPDHALDAQIIGIAGALETGHCFRKFVEG